MLLLAFSVSSGFFAIESEAAYQNLTATTTATVDSVSKVFPVSNAVWEYGNSSDTRNNVGVVTMYSDIVVRYDVTFTGNYYYSTPYYLLGRISTRMNVKWNNPNISLPGVSGATSRWLQPIDMRAEIIDTWSQDYISGDFDTMIGSSDYSTTSSINKTFYNYTSFRKEAGANVGNSAPRYYQRIRVYFSCPITYYTWLYPQDLPAPTVTFTMSTPTAYRIIEKADTIPYAKQNADNLQSLVNGIINDPEAGSVMDAANDHFVQEAGALQSGQAALEGAADNSMAAVDFGQVDLIDTYSGSVNFWMSLINQLPTILGAFWSVLIFALIIAFVLFIVRIRR